MTTELAKQYDPKSVETEVAQKWTDAGAFNAEPSDAGEKYCIVIPPPNVTAALHLGHALNNTLQDILTRWRRMQQFNALWMPGTDHAGIATQTVVDKRLKAEGHADLAEYRRMEAEGKGGRVQFVTKVQAWKDEYEARILGQLKMMGCSCDWRRTRFTMDDVCAKAVREVFFKLFSDELIYRGKRLVNWDPATQTVLADDEVEHEEIRGFFWYLKYPLETPVVIDGVRVEHITVATTRPETMLGDTAVAMNPGDPRAASLVGKRVRLPIVGRLIPIIADDHVVLPNPESEDEKARFSTGFLKVTPAHDPEDYAIRQRHPEIDIINILAPDGSISDKFGWTDWEQVKNPDVENLIGMDRFEARDAIVVFFRHEGLLENIRDYTHQVGHSYRSHVPIEPYLSDQWYVAVKKPIANLESRVANCELGEVKDGVTYIKGTDVPVNSLAGLALMPLVDGRLKFVPDRYANNYRSWLENLRDWPISRQLWWGHQIPVWRASFSADWRLVPDEIRNSNSDRLEAFHEAFAQALNSFCTSAGIAEGVSIHRANEVSAFVCPKSERGHRLLAAFEEYKESFRPKPLGPGGEITARACNEIPGFPSATASVENLFRSVTSFTRDADVLDTWFSSALWPFSTLGWPDSNDALKKWYPGDVLCTAREIITLWVSRMVMMGQYCLGDIPYHDVFIHAMIQDGEGRKMSKSLGNGIDPLDIIDSHGADAMRFTLCSMTTQTQDVRMPVEAMTLPDGRKVNSSPKFDLGRNFCNKLWNASRFVMMRLEGAPDWSEIDPRANLADAWILSRLNTTIRDASAALENYRFNELADTLYHFMWDDFCDWYVEIAKSRTNAGETAPKAVLAHCMDSILRLLHPVAPFITEAIWQNLNAVAPRRGPGNAQAEPMLVRANWPKADLSLIDADAEGRFALTADLIRGIRNVRTQHNVPPSRKLDVIIEAAPQTAELLTANADLMKSQANLGSLTISSQPVAPPADAASVALAGITMYVPGIVDRSAETTRLTKQKEQLAKGIAAIEGKLGNEQFIAKAPPALVEKERQRLEGFKADLAAVDKSLESLK